MAAPNLKTVAETSGYGVSTVSYVLRGKAEDMKIPAATRDRILQVAKQLGYRRNRIGAALSTGKTGFIALVSAAYGHPWREARQAIAATTLTENGYHVHQFDTHWDAGNPLRMVDEILSLRPDGILVSDVTHNSRLAMLQRIGESGIPTVGLDYLEGNGFDCVHLDRVAAGRLPAEHLLALGHRDLLYVMPARRESAGLFYLAHRLQGFHAALQSAGVEPREDHVLWLESLATRDLLATGYEAFGVIQKESSRALIFTNDLMVLGFTKACHERGIVIPRDVSLVGSEDLAVCRYLPVAPTTLTFPVPALVDRAVSMLRERLDGYSGPPRREPFAPAIAVRDSTAGPCRDVPKN